MKISFILSQVNNIYLIKTLYEIATSLKEITDNDVYFYLSDLKNISCLKGDTLKIRCLNEKQVATLPEADFIISTDTNILLELSMISRGELIYVNSKKKPPQGLAAKIRIVDFFELIPAVPPEFYQQTEEKRGKVIIAADSLNEQNLKLVIKSLNKLKTPSFPTEVVILDCPSSYDFKTKFKLKYIESAKTNFKNLLARSFFLLYLNKDSFPILSLWTMAAGVITINIQLDKQKNDLPLELLELSPLSLALRMIKIYKMGQLRKEILTKSYDYVQEFNVKKAGKLWHNYLDGILTLSNKGEKLSGEKKAKKANVDLIIIDENKKNSASDLNNCLEKIKALTEIPYNLYILTDDSKHKNVEEDNLLIIEQENNLNYAQSCNQGILAGQADYIVLLNSKVLVKKGWLKPLIEEAKRDEVALVAPELLDSDEKIIRPLINLDAYSNKEEVNTLGGPCLLLKRELLAVIGLFEERLSFNLAEIDYSLRAREKDYKLISCSESKVYIKEDELILNDLKLENNHDKEVKFFKEKWSDILAGGEKRRETKNIVVAGSVPWDCYQGRDQHLILNLVKLGYQVLYLNPICDYKPLEEIEKNLFIYNPAGYGTIKYNFNKEQIVDIASDINKKINKLDFTNSIIILNTPYWLPLLKYLQYSILVYDCTENIGKEKSYLKKQEEQLLELTDLVLTNRQELYKEKKVLNQNTYLLADGVDYEHFNDKFIKKPVELRKNKKIIACYYQRAADLDCDLLYALAKELPADIEMVLIGEESSDLSKLASLAQVSFVGIKDYQLLPSYFHCFDLCLLPFKEKLNSSILGIFLQYLACGKPILATNIAELSYYSQMLTIGKTKEDFILYALDLCKNVNINKEQVDEFLQNNSWQLRAVYLSCLFHISYYQLFPAGLVDKEELVAKMVSSNLSQNKGLNIVEDDNWFYRLKRWIRK